MGAARLLAKGWFVLCFYAGASALAVALARGTPLPEALAALGPCVLLFAAMGLVLAGGYGVAGVRGHLPKLAAADFAPGFAEGTFLVFAAASLAVQIAAPPHPQGGLFAYLDAAVRAIVPAQRALEAKLELCGPALAHSAAAAAFTWLLALVFFGSSLSRLSLAAGIVRLERRRRVEPLGDYVLALFVAVVAVFAIQFLFVGTLYALAPCGVLSGITGALLTGLAPLMLAYLISAALTNLLALNAEA